MRRGSLICLVVISCGGGGWGSRARGVTYIRLVAEKFGKETLQFRKNKLNSDGEGVQRTKNDADGQQSVELHLLPRQIKF